MPLETPYACPVCRARFREAAQCPRCGTDLSRPMLLAAAATRLRNAARRAVIDQDVDKAHRLAQQAQKNCPTSKGESLLLLIEWLKRLG